MEPGGKGWGGPDVAAFSYGFLPEVFWTFQAIGEVYLTMQEHRTYLTASLLDL